MKTKEEITNEIDRFTFPPFLEEFSIGFYLSSYGARPFAAGITHIFIPNIDSTTIEPYVVGCSDYKRLLFSDDRIASDLCG